MDSQIESQTELPIDAASLLQHARDVVGDQNAIFTINVTLTTLEGNTFTQSATSTSQDDIPTKIFSFTDLQIGQKVFIDIELYQDEKICFYSYGTEVQVTQESQPVKIILTKVKDDLHTPSSFSHCTMAFISLTQIEFSWNKPIEDDINYVEIEYEPWDNSSPSKSIKVRNALSTIVTLESDKIYTFKLYVVDFAGNK